MKILFVHNHLATFTRIDLGILREVHEVREQHVRRTGAEHLFQDHAGLLAGVEWADLIFAWFGGYHALLPFTLARLRGRKCVVVASGYDVADMPEVAYGNMRPGIRRPIGQSVFALAHRVLAVSNFTRSEAIHNAGVPADKIQVIAHGLDTGCFNPGAPDSRKMQVLTVASITRATMRTKGLPDFVSTAAMLPDIPFIIVGPQDRDATALLRSNATPNVQFWGPMQHAAMVAVMQQSAVYVQLSAYESFGMAVAEAMSCSCAVVVSNRGALPEVVGDAGWVVPHGDIQSTAGAIRQALAAPEQANERGRRRVIELFSLERRRQALLAAIEDVGKKQ